MATVLMEDLALNREEVQHLYNYFMKCGYISFETDMPIHELFKVFSSFLNGSKENGARIEERQAGETEINEAYRPEISER